jgi:outer membrane usher protein
MAAAARPTERAGAMLDCAGPEPGWPLDPDRLRRTPLVRLVPLHCAEILPEVAFGSAQAEARPVSPEEQHPTARINPTGRELRFIVPLADGELYLGDLELAVSPQDELSVDGSRLIELLKDRLTAELLVQLHAGVNDKGRLSAAVLANAGIVLTYDSERLSLSVNLPIAARSRQALSFRGSGYGEEAVTLEPAKLSAFVNVFASAGHVQSATGRGLIAPSAQIAGAVRFNGLVLESEGYVSARSGDTAWRRTGTRLVYDDQHRAMRWTLGDTQFQPRQFQASATVFGLGVSRLYSVIDPQREVRASGAQSFAILNPGTIETIVNGRPVERRVVQPGNYTLRDFPVAQGSNAVQLRIEESGGRVRTIDFSVYSNQSLLAQHVTEFAAFAGVYAQPSARGFSYSREWMAGGFVRHGMTEQLTIGVNFQANRSYQQAAVEGTLGSPIGLVGFNLASSRDPSRKTGLAAAITFERLLSSSEGGQSDGFRAAVEWRSPKFVIPEVAFGPDRKVWSLTAGYVHSFKSGAFVSVDGQVQRNRLPRVFEYGGRAAGGIPIGERFELNPEIGFSRGSANRESYFRLGLRMKLGRSGSARFDADSKGRARTSFSLSDGAGLGSRQYSGDIARDNGMVALTANASLQTNRADLSIQQTAGYSETTRRVEDSRTTIRAAFSLAWAGGTLTMGRPINDSFLIARGHPTLRGKRILLDPSNDGEAARSDRFGPALLGQISAYARRSVIYSVPDAPSGYDLGPGNVSIRPPYKAGYNLTIGSDYNLLVLGRLLDRSGEPVSLLAGQAFDLDNPKHPAITIFTSRDGRFGAQGLRAGHWRIEMPGDVPLAYWFTVTAGDDGTARVGNLSPAQEAATGRNRK